MLLKIFSRKESKHSFFSLRLSDNGWNILQTPEEIPPVAPHLFEQCDKLGQPALSNWLDAHCNNTEPGDFKEALQDLWEIAHTKKLNEPEIQSRLDRISHWLDSYLKPVSQF